MENISGVENMPVEESADEMVQDNVDVETPDIESDIEDNEVWEDTAQEPAQNDDSEVWESDEDVSPEDNAEVWEDDKHYSDENSEEEHPQSVKDRIKSFISPNHSDSDGKKHSFLSGLKFTKDLTLGDDLNDEVTEDLDVEDANVNENIADDKVDLGSDDDYIYVDHSNDEITEDDIPKVKFDKKVDEFIVDEPVVEVESPVEEPVVDEPVVEVESPVEENIHAKHDSYSDGSKKSPKKSVKEDMFDDKVDLGSDEDYIYVDHSADDIDLELSVDDKVDLGSDDYVNVDRNADDIDFEPSVDDNVDLGSDNHVNVDDIDSEPSVDDKVDLGSDEDYIYVDHSNDEPSSFSQEESEPEEVQNPVEVSDDIKSRKRPKFVESIISEVIHGESKLEPEEIEIVHGEIIEEESEQLYKPAPKDEFVVEAEIVNGKEELNIFNDNLPDDNEVLERPDSKYDFDDENEELNIFNDNLPDWDNDGPENIVDKAVNHYLDDDIFKEEETESDAEENEPQEVAGEKTAPEPVVDEGVTYYQGSNDVTSKLRKNNFYYDDEKPKSVKDSLRGIKRDMKYINKSLKEIENPTHVDYVSVVDRTEEYDPADYLNMPSDDDSDKIIAREEELTFAEKEEIRIERELNGEPAQTIKDSEEEVIVPVHEQFRREDLKDQALEDIIQTANDDYKEIEKERKRQENQLKAFDDHKLPGKKKLEDNIIPYVEASDIGLNSSDDLFKRPIDNVSQSIVNIVDVEGPIHVNDVTKRVKDSCNIKRAGSNLKKTVNRAIENAESSGDIIKIGDFLYDASDNNVIVRKRNKPNIELISDEEIAKSIELILIHKSNVTTSQIPKEAARNFGFKSTSKKTASRINSVLDLMIANNRVKIVNDFVELT